MSHRVISAFAGSGSPTPDRTLTGPTRNTFSPGAGQAAISRNALEQDTGISRRNLKSTLDQYPLSGVSSPSDQSSDFDITRELRSVRKSVPPEGYPKHMKSTFSSYAPDVSSAVGGNKFQDDDPGRLATIKALDEQYKQASMERDLVRQKIRERERRLDEQLQKQRERCEYFNAREWGRVEQALDEMSANTSQREDQSEISDTASRRAQRETILKEKIKQEAMLDRSPPPSDILMPSPDKEISKEVERALIARRRQMREMDVEYNTLREDNEKLHSAVLKISGKLNQTRRQMREAEGRWEATQEENQKLMAERNHLSNELHQIRVQNSYLSSLVEEFQHKTPMVVVRNKEPEVVSWTIDDAARRFRETERPRCLFSPPLTSKALQKVEIEFFPNGRGDAPRGHCTVMVRLDKGSRVTLQMFVGTKRTNNLEVVFTANDQGYSEHFIDPRSEIDRRTDTLTVGIMILKNHQSAKYIIY